MRGARAGPRRGSRSRTHGLCCFDSALCHLWKDGRERPDRPNVITCGIGIVTNSVQRVPGARFALVRDTTTTVDTKGHLNANVTGFGGRIPIQFLIQDIALALLEAFRHPTPPNQTPRIVARFFLSLLLGLMRPADNRSVSAGRSVLWSNHDPRRITSTPDGGRWRNATSHDFPAACWFRPVTEQRHGIAECGIGGGNARRNATSRSSREGRIRRMAR